jgi:hypothetical protein
VSSRWVWLRYLACGFWLAGLCSVTAPRAWVSLTMPSATAWVKATGMPVEWEWKDAAQTSMFFEADPEWRSRGGGRLTDQNAARTVAPVLISVAGKWLHDAWVAGVFVAWLSWCVCMWAVVALVRQGFGFRSEVSGWASVWAALLLVGTSTGFLGNVGDIDAHVVGYAGCASGIFMLLKYFEVAGTPGRNGRWPALFGLGIFLAEGALQLGAPLLALWALLLGREVTRADRFRRQKLLANVPRALIVCGLCVACWSIIARVGSDGSFDVHNEAFARAREAASDPLSLVSTFPFKARGVFGQVLDLFRWWLVAAAILGWGLASWQVRYWTVCWVALVVCATVLTRYSPSTVFLVFPVIYVLAATTAGRLADVLFTAVPVGMFGSYRMALVAGVSALVVSLVPALTQLGFLWGDYTMPAVWWPGP